MRICIYTETALPMLGGQELTVDALAREFLACGHEVVVLAPQPRSPLTADDNQRPYRVVRHPRFISTWRFVGFYGRYLRRLHRERRFDVIHCHSVHPAGHLAIRLKRATGVPVVVTSHGGDVAASNNKLAKPGIAVQSAAVLREADALVAISRFTREAYRRLAPQPAPIHDIPNGVHARAFAQAASRPADLDPAIVAGSYFLCPGRLARRKGVDMLLEALATIEMPARPMVVLAGGGEERAALEATAERLGITASVRFLGPVQGSLKIWLLQNALAIVMPSRDWEAFPLVVLESYAAGRPVIATRVPGLEDLIVPGRNGWLVAPEAPTELGQLLREVSDDRGTADRLGRTARQEALGFDWSAIASRYLALFEGLAAQARR